MGFNLIAGAIKSGHFKEAKQLIKLCETSNLFEKGMHLHFKKYLLFRKLKGYKLPFADKFISKKIDRCIPIANQTVGKIKYSAVINW